MRDTTAALEAEYSVEPALERRPATEAVAMMEPEGWGFDAEVCCMAVEACLVAKKTLGDVVSKCFRGVIWIGRDKGKDTLKRSSSMYS